MEIAASLLDAAKNHPEECHRIGSLHQLMDVLLQSDNPLLVTEFFRQWPDLLASPSVAFRQQLPEIVRKIGTKASGNLREAVFALTALLNDGSKEVVRQSISNATVLFRTALDGETDGQSLRENFMAAVSGLVHRQGFSDEVKFVALKFLEKMILLLADGHAADAAKHLGFMLDLLPAKLGVVKTSTSVVVIKSLMEIAKQRPEFCGCVLQVLVDLNPDVKSARGHIGSLVFALKAAFLALLRCPHWGALPWRDRLLAVLRGMHFGEAAEQAIRRADRALREKKRAVKKKAPAEKTWKEKAAKEKLDDADVAENRLAPALQKLTVRQPEAERESGEGSLPGHVDKAVSGSVHVEERCDVVHEIVARIGALVEEGEKGCEPIEILISKMNPDLLADVVIANMSNLPRSSADVSMPAVCQIGTPEVLSRVVSST